VPTTYYLRSTSTNGITPPTSEFTSTRDILTTTAALATVVTSQPTTGATEIGYAYTAASVPGSAGVAGTWTVEVNVTASFSTSMISVQIHRVNSTGTVQASSTTTAEQAGSSTGVKTFSVNASGIGPFGATDRIRVDYRFRNTSTMTAGGPTIGFNTTDSEIIMPDASTPSLVFRKDITTTPLWRM
jgi:hypothetical protein